MTMLFHSITDGATLKLVLAMRGGPINTRRSKSEIFLIITNTFQNQVIFKCCHIQTAPWITIKKIMIFQPSSHGFSLIHSKDKDLTRSCHYMVSLIGFCSWLYTVPLLVYFLVMSLCSCEKIVSKWYNSIQLIYRNLSFLL